MNRSHVENNVINPSPASQQVFALKKKSQEKASTVEVYAMIK